MNTFTVEEMSGTYILRVQPQRMTLQDVVDTFQSDLNALADEHPSSHFILDMSRMDFIGSAVIGALIQAFKRVKDSGGELVLACLQPPAEAVLKMTRLSAVFPIYDTVEAALRRNWVSGQGAS